MPTRRPALLKGFIGWRPITNADGEFGLDGVVPDTPISLRAELNGRVSDVVTVTVEPGMVGGTFASHCPLESRKADDEA